MTPRDADSARRVGNAREHTFTVENVIVIAPDQDDGQDVHVQKDDLVTTPDMFTQSDFKPRRMVMNLILGKGQAGSIQPAVTIRIKVTDEDNRNAGGPDKVKVAYWYQGKWIVFGEKHGFRIDGGYAQATLAAWGDPPIGVGP